MVIWIMSNCKSKINAVIQIMIVVSMNLLEFLLVPKLLIWGLLNSILHFCLIVSMV